ncbi:Ca2+-dependent phosphoinositide-specific phospholipase C [Paraoerskovia marina]|uniref:Ca2+-dependent phosphoinositide-specific phospholipase C n=1 Tax=Paraoerskovia marina TaxID=545619 RepID=UPI000492B167|nr:Ca2+-dependent phosphoinositide-specific phospholipase C [Paraoerskovia marina]
MTQPPSVETAPSSLAKPRDTRTRASRRVLIAVAGVLGAAVMLTGALVLYLLAQGWTSASAQTQRLDDARAEVAGLADGEVAAWTDPAGDATVSDHLAYDDLQVIGTHNSYVEEPTWLQLQLIGLVEPASKSTLRYGHDPLWDQLEDGVRSIEWDVRDHGDRFSMAHVPLVANRGTSPDLELALEELGLWSSSHPDHLPVSLMVEFKKDYAFLDPSLQAFDADSYDRWDALLEESLGEALFTPDDLRGSAPSPRDAVETTGWPTVGELRGRILVFAWDDEEVREQYLAGHENLRGRAMFTSSRTGGSDAVFAVHDDPHDAAIADAAAAGIVVRTRTDADLDVGGDDLAAALASGANILSTDFPASEADPVSGYAATFADSPATARAVPGRATD